MRINVLAGSEEGGAAEKPGGPLSQNARPKPPKHNKQQQQCSVSRLSNIVNVSFRFQENLTRWKHCNKFTPHATSAHAPVVNGVSRREWNWYMFMIRTRGGQSLTISIWTVVIYPEKSLGCNPDLLLKKHWIGVTLDGRVEPREAFRLLLMQQNVYLSRNYITTIQEIFYNGLSYILVIVYPKQAQAWDLKNNVTHFTWA